MAQDYLLAGRRSELERLQLQSRVWEPAGAKLLERRLGDGAGRRALDVGCGAMGWLGILSQWVGSGGEVVGTDLDTNVLQAARALVDTEQLSNVSVIEDDLFSSRLEPASFDVVHARFQLAPLGRVVEQLAAYRRLVRAGGVIVLEEPDASSWHFNPAADSAEQLIALILQAFTAAGGDFDAGRQLPQLLRELGAEPTVDAHVLALPAGHPYLRLPLQFANALEQRLLELVSSDELAALRTEAEHELTAPYRWGTTFTLIQSHGRVTAEAER
jgi:ubiquinone/menaquinone biosynthesis C-methylase UbiE